MGRRSRRELVEVPGLSGQDTLDGSELALTRVVSLGQAMGSMAALFVAATLFGLAFGEGTPPGWIFALMVPVAVAISRKSAHDVSVRIWPHKVVLSGRLGLIPRQQELTLRGPVQLGWRRHGRGIAGRRQRAALFTLTFTDDEGQQVSLGGVRCTEEELSSIQARLQTVGRHLEGPDQHPDLVPDELRRLQAQPVSER